MPAYDTLIMIFVDNTPGQNQHVQDGQSSSDDGQQPQQQQQTGAGNGTPMDIDDQGNDLQPTTSALTRKYSFSF